MRCKHLNDLYPLDKYLHTNSYTRKVAPNLKSGPSNGWEEIFHRHEHFLLKIKLEFRQRPKSWPNHKSHIIFIRGVGVRMGVVEGATELQWCQSWCLV